MPAITIKDLVKAGLHFGHAAQSWNPKMKQFIYGKKKKIHVIDLRHTVKSLVTAVHLVSKLAAQGGKFMFVGTKIQAQAPIKEIANSTGSYYVNERWLGGMLTNHEVILSRINRMKELEAIDASENAGYSKKMLASLNRELKKLHRDLSGVRTMSVLPNMLIVIDPKHELTAVKEAKICGIPVIALGDTNCDPDMADLFIPGNDDAIRGISMILGCIAEGIIEGQKNIPSQEPEIVKETPAAEEVSSEEATEEIAQAPETPAPETATQEVAAPVQEEKAEALPETKAETDETQPVAEA